jgi:hypothetical protein
VSLRRPEPNAATTRCAIPPYKAHSRALAVNRASILDQIPGHAGVPPHAEAKFQRLLVEYPQQKIIDKRLKSPSAGPSMIGIGQHLKFNP